MLIILFSREELYEEYSQQFATLVQMWNLDVKKVKEQGEKLAVGIRLSISITCLYHSLE